MPHPDGAARLPPSASASASPDSVGGAHDIGERGAEALAPMMLAAARGDRLRKVFMMKSLGLCSCQLLLAATPLACGDTPIDGP